MPTPLRSASSLALLCLLTALAPAARAQAGGASPATLDSIAASWVSTNRTIGLVAAVVAGPDTLLHRAYGRANVEWDVPMTTDAMFEAGSVAKQFAAAAILLLRDAGTLTLDDPLARWLPELGAESQGITLRQLLNHTSGIFRFSEEYDWERAMFVPGLPRDTARAMIRLTPRQFPAGQAQAYSNSGFWLVGLVVERASGMPYEQFLATRIFQPLGMTRSSVCNSLEHVPRRAQGYALRGPTVLRAPMVSYTWVFAPGALCTTAGDLITWMQALHGGRLLSPESYAEMTTPARLADGHAIQYGLGIKVGVDAQGHRYIGHGGTAPGFRADATWYPDAKLAVVVLMNTSAPNLSASTVAMQLARARLPRPRAELGFYTGDPSRFVGQYELVLGGNITSMTIEVSAGAQGLSFSYNGSRPQPLPWAGGSTFYGSETASLTFTTSAGEGGPMTELRRDDAGNYAILRRR